MQNSTIIKQVKSLCRNDDVDYNDIVDALCDPKLYSLLSEIIATLILNNVPETYVNAVYFYHQGKSPLDVHPLLPQMELYSVSGECTARILQACRRSKVEYPLICKDIIVRYVFSDGVFKDYSIITNHQSFEPFCLEEVKLYERYIAKYLTFSCIKSLISYGKFDKESFKYILNHVCNRNLNHDNASGLLKAIHYSKVFSDKEKEEYADILIRANNKWALVYGGERQ